MHSFYKNRRWYFSISLLLILIGTVTSIFAGIEMDIEFKGGSIVTYEHRDKIDLSVAEDAIHQAIRKNVSCQEITSLGSDQISLVINIAGNEALPSEELAIVEEALNEQFPGQEFNLQSTNLVDPFIGRETLVRSIWAISIASILIVLYVWIQFRSMSGPSAGVMALIALFHDALLAFFVFVVLRIPLNETLIAVLLSILGFSINDTIVIYDRIRENKRIHKTSMPLPELVDLSINQSLSRSINTSLAAVVAVAVAYIFAYYYNIASIKEFALPLMIGLICGTYSSIAIAGPLWVMWKTRGGRSGY